MKAIKTVLTTGLLLTALPALAAETVTAQLPKAGEKPACEGKCFDSKLKLSDEQRTKLGALRDRFTLDTATKSAELEVSMRQMHELMSAPIIDKSAVLSLEAKINSLKAELSTARVNLMLASSDVFTPEQRAQFSKFMEMRHHGRGGREHGPGFGKPGCGGPGFDGPGHREFGKGPLG